MSLPSYVEAKELFENINNNFLFSNYFIFIYLLNIYGVSYPWSSNIYFSYFAENYLSHLWRVILYENGRHFCVAEAQQITTQIIDYGQNRLLINEERLIAWHSMKVA